jgi:hypothetical protein
VHDRSKALAREQHIWEVVLSPDVPAAIVGHDRRTIQFPLGVTEVQHADSRDYPELQLTDILAGATSVYVRNKWNGESHLRPEYVRELEAVDILEPIVNSVWPTMAVTPEELGTDGPALESSVDFIGRLLRDRRQRT